MIIYQADSVKFTGAFLPDKVYHCTALPGCHVEGENCEKTLVEMKAAIEVFIEDYKEQGEAIPEDDVIITTMKVAV